MTMDEYTRRLAVLHAETADGTGPEVMRPPVAASR
jgi:hypothetical protein